ncbi:MAG TPA: biopolymer transporter ExbD [Thermoanaerobaculaceae bacterium]|nr:biopolymer transporter ExbD [Thermoanaerobaculaceae bacterium]HRS15718.1 biopolymer transporter ExbD [Thermoanaerobaculaceae bacterium]
MTFRTGDDFENLAEINITPLVDVMMVLLIIFIVTAPMLVQGLQVDLPRATSAPLPQRGPEPIVLTLTRDRLILLGDEPVHLKLLSGKLAPLLAGGPRPVYLKGDQQLPYGFVIEVLSTLNQLGVEEIGMVTVPPRP